MTARSYRQAMDGKLGGTQRFWYNWFRVEKRTWPVEPWVRSGLNVGRPFAGGDHCCADLNDRMSNETGAYCRFDAPRAGGSLDRGWNRQARRLHCGMTEVHQRPNPQPKRS